jgi:hypothetical protein
MRTQPIRAAVLGLSAMILTLLSLSHAADSDKSKAPVQSQDSSSFTAGYQDGLRQGLSAARGKAQGEAAATATKVEDKEEDDGGC